MSHKGKLYDGLQDKEKADEILSLFGKLSENDRNTMVKLILNFSPSNGKGDNEMDISL